MNEARKKKEKKERERVSGVFAERLSPGGPPDYFARATGMMKNSRWLEKSHLRVYLRGLFLTLISSLLEKLTKF